MRTAFERTIDNILQYGLRTHQLHPFPYSIAVRFSAGLAAFGRLFSRTDWSQTGLKWLMELGTTNTQAADSWCHTGHLADLLVAAQIVPHEFKMPCWDSFWSFISDTWQPELACYCGPALHERQEQYEPEVTLYDLYLGYLTGKLAGRAEKLKFVHLQAALVHPFDLEIKPAPVKLVKGFFNEENWTCINRADRAVTLLEKTQSLSKKREKIYPSLRILWGNKEITHSLVCQNGQASRITHLWNEPIAEMLFDLEEPFESKIEMAREICFYFDMHADLNFTVNGRRTNTFGLGETVILHLSGNKEIQMVFELVEGEGDFMGHIAQANRPSQTRQLSDKKPRIFDWVLFLRTLRRSGYCKIKAGISIREI